MWEYVESWEEKTSLQNRPEVLSAISLPTNLNLNLNIGYKLSKIFLEIFLAATAS
jgi:hypothetical protein